MSILTINCLQYKKGNKDRYFWKSTDGEWLLSNNQIEIQALFDKNAEQNKKGLIESSDVPASSKANIINRKLSLSLNKVLIADVLEVIKHSSEFLTAREIYEELSYKHSRPSVSNALYNCNDILRTGFKRKCSFSNQKVFTWKGP